MLIHLKPRLLALNSDASLLEMLVQPFGLHLIDGMDVRTGRLYPNKGYNVVCRKKGRKAMDGILLNVRGVVDQFSYTARWFSHGFNLSHHVRCTILDHDFGAVSESTTLWRPTPDGRWPDRRPDGWTDSGSVRSEPYMELEPHVMRGIRTEDEVDPETGWIRQRTQLVPMPTLEEARLFLYPGEDSSRMPSIDDAFDVAAPQRPCRVPLKHSVQVEP